MEPISFFTPVNYGPFAKTTSEALLEKIDDYFFLFGRKAQVIPLTSEQGRKGVGYYQDQSPHFKTALKVASYFTLVLPALALIAKTILRYIHQFHLVSPGPSYIGAVAPTSPSPTPPSQRDASNQHEHLEWKKEGLHTFPLLSQFGKVYALTCEEVVKLKIKQSVMVAVMNSGHAATEDGPGFSDLETYKDSNFTCNWIYDDNTQQSTYYITRHRSLSPPYVPLCKPTTIEQGSFNELNLVKSTNAADESLGFQGKSRCPQYEGSKFYWNRSPHKGFPNGVILRY